MKNEIHERLKDECINALNTLQKISDPDTLELESKLAWCLGSYDFDYNPVGLHEYGTVALQTLKDIKAEKPRKVNKKVIEGLEKSIKNYEVILN